LSRKRVQRNRQLSENERKSIRKMKNTVFFGQTVQKLDEARELLTYDMNESLRHCACIATECIDH
jgi:hypothetical protein